jgi:pectate lyase
LGATGWASYYSNGSGTTTGGNGAVASKIYTVTTRAELIQALYGNSATISSTGSYSGTLDSSPKIIYISGTISLNRNGSDTELTADDYLTYANAASTTCKNYNITTSDALWTAYYAAYKPSVWGNATTVSGTPESARACASNYQQKVVKIYVPSNTSIIGLGSNAKIIHGNLVLGDSGAAVDNIVIRNVAFEDAFDFFPQWDPTDSTTGRWNSNYDLISVLYATHVWIDHNTFSDGARTDDLYPSVWTGTASDNTNYATNEVYKVQHHDGLVDVTKLGNYVTLSYNYFHDHDKSFLIGGTDTASLTAEHPGVLNITFSHNYFQNLKQRQPRVRYGMVHIYDNYYEGSLSSSDIYSFSVGWTIGQGGKIYAENNAFVISNGTAAVKNLYGYSLSSSKVSSCASLSGMSTALCSAYFYDSGTLLNGATVDVTSAITNASSLISSGASYWLPSTYYSYTLDSAPTTAPTASVGAGVL